MRFLTYLLLVFTIAAPAAYNQETTPPAGGERQAEMQEHLRLAISSIDYPVTPGDVYRLTYYQTADSPVTREILVDGNSSVDFGIFGKIDAEGMRFVDLKNRVEDLIAKSYSRSLPQLRITTPGVFRVAVTGEVDRVQYITAWGLTRLGTIVDSARGRYSSLRAVRVVSRSGGSRTYDLLKSMRLNSPVHDPYVRPGDTIVLFPAQRIVELSGQVRHPGRYELMQDEGLRELIEVFGGGLTNDATTDRIRIDRSPQPGVAAHAEYVALPGAYSAGLSLNNGDAVRVPSKDDRVMVVWFEGAVSAQRLQGAGRAAGAPTVAGGDGETREVPTGAPMQVLGDRDYPRFSHPVRRGQMLSDALAEIRAAILPEADVSSATLYREGSAEPIPVDLAELIAEPGAANDVALEPNDTIYIPVLRFTIAVSGAVIAPGFFPYQPGAPASYYISMAGGVDPERNGNGSYWVEDQSGKHRQPTDRLLPGDRVYVPLNAAGYRLRQSMPTVVAIISAILNTVTLVYLLTR